VAVKDVSVEGVKETLVAPRKSDQSGYAPECASLGRMGIYDVRLFAPHERDQLPQRDNVVAPGYFTTHLGYDKGLDTAFHREPTRLEKRDIFLADYRDLTPYPDPSADSSSSAIRGAVTARLYCASTRLRPAEPMRSRRSVFSRSRVRASVQSPVSRARKPLTP